MVALRLSATLESAQVARDALEEIPELAVHEDLQFVAALLVTELVINAVRHAAVETDAEVALLAEATGELVHVEVCDSGPGFFPLPHTRSGPGHRLAHGLHLVDVLADRWGFRCSSPGCSMWFELDLVPGRRAWRGREPIRDRAARMPSAPPFRS